MNLTGLSSICTYMNHISRTAWRQPRHRAIAIGPLALFNICTATAPTAIWSLILIQNPSDVLGQYISCLSDPHFKPLVNPITLLGVLITDSQRELILFILLNICTHILLNTWLLKLHQGTKTWKTAITTLIAKKGHHVMVTDNRIQWLANQN